jgi:arylsulfatase A-like enzyme
MHFHTANMYSPVRTVRDDRYKLHLNLFPTAGKTAVELYDLRSDPGETKNLADDAALAHVRQRLEAALDAWRRQTHDPLLDAARLKRWNAAAERWKGSAPRLEDSSYADVARVPPGELKLLD